MEEQEITLFYSYSHKDESYRDSLEAHLSILTRKKIISGWHDRKILPGKEWKKEIDKELETADIILLLISSDFIASDYCYEKELEKAMERHELNETIVIPIIIRPTDWSDTPFSYLQALPTDAKSVTSWENEDEAWLDIVSGIKKATIEINSLKSRRKENTGFHSMKALLSSEVNSIDNLYHGQSGIRGLSTGLQDLDYFTDGLHPSELITIASRPRVGKTDLIAQISTNIAIGLNQPVAFFSFKIPADRITRKFISSLGRIDFHTLLTGTLNDEDWTRLTSSFAILHKAPIYIDDSISISFDAFKKKIIDIVEEKKVKLVVIDSLQHLYVGIKNTNPNVTPSDITKWLSTLSRELKIPIIITTTLTQDVEKRLNKRPLFSDLGEWRVLEDDSDTVIFIYREEFYNPETCDKGSAEIIVAKNASEGPIGTVQSLYLSRYSMFTDRHNNLINEKNNSEV